MRTQDRGYFLLTLRIAVCLLSLFPLLTTYASSAEDTTPWNTWKCRGCSESSCKKNPAIGTDCVNHCATHSGAGPQCLAAKKTTAVVKAGGASDAAYTKNLHNLFFAALKAEAGGSLQVNSSNSDTIETAIKMEIRDTLKLWDSKYIGFTKRTPQHIKNLVAACNKNPSKNCGVYKDEALFRIQFCPPSTVKDCIKAKGTSDFPGEEIKIHLEPAAMTLLTGGNSDDSSGSGSTDTGSTSKSGKPLKRSKSSLK
jgi:hypothetical protein